MRHCRPSSTPVIPVFWSCSLGFLADWGCAHARLSNSMHGNTNESVGQSAVSQYIPFVAFHLTQYLCLSSLPLCLPSRLPQCRGELPLQRWGFSALVGERGVCFLNIPTMSWLRLMDTTNGWQQSVCVCSEAGSRLQKNRTFLKSCLQIFKIFKSLTRKKSGEHQNKLMSGLPRFCFSSWDAPAE